MNSKEENRGAKHGRIVVTYLNAHSMSKIHRMIQYKKRHAKLREID